MPINPQPDHDELNEDHAKADAWHAKFGGHLVKDETGAFVFAYRSTYNNIYSTRFEGGEQRRVDTPPDYQPHDEPEADAEQPKADDKGKTKQQAGANDNNPHANAEASSRLRILNPADWHGKPVPERSWFVEGLIPGRNVTLLSGDGGVGKSLLALQIGAAAALGVETLGLAPKPGRVFYLGAEDEEDEFQRRLAAIVENLGRTLADLGDNFQLVAMAGRDATLALPDSGKRIQPTLVMQALVEEVTNYRPNLLVLDTSANLFGGDEINRVQVRTFVGMLMNIALKLDCAVVLLSHPSVAGMLSGSGLSGSTAWNNSVRSRLYLTSLKDALDGRVLSTAKANFGKPGGRSRFDTTKAPLPLILVQLQLRRQACSTSIPTSFSSPFCRSCTGRVRRSARTAALPTLQRSWLV